MCTNNLEPHAVCVGLQAGCPLEEIISAENVQVEIYP